MNRLILMGLAAAGGIAMLALARHELAKQFDEVRTHAAEAQPIPTGSAFASDEMQAAIENLNSGDEKDVALKLRSQQTGISVDDLQNEPFARTGNPE